MLLIVLTITSLHLPNMHLPIDRKIKFSIVYLVNNGSNYTKSFSGLFSLPLRCCFLLGLTGPGSLLHCWPFSVSYSSSLVFVCRSPQSPLFLRLWVWAINITPERVREGLDDRREVTRCSSVTNRWLTPVLALTAQLAANEPTASLALSAAAQRLGVTAPASAASHWAAPWPRESERIAVTRGKWTQREARRLWADSLSPDSKPQCRPAFMVYSRHFWAKRRSLLKKPMTSTIWVGLHDTQRLQEIKRQICCL